MEEIKEINWNMKENKQLLEVFLALKNKDEAKRFLRDLMTRGEIEEFARRLETASLLAKDTEYLSITEKVGLSSTTIARIQKWLRGPLGGYRLILNKLHHTHFQNSVGKGLS
jgi:TrpR-related protein YerC/YecD